MSVVYWVMRREKIDKLCAASSDICSQALCHASISACVFNPTKPLSRFFSSRETVEEGSFSMFLV